MIISAEQDFICPNTTLECKDLNCEGEYSKAVNKAGECCCRIKSDEDEAE